MKAVVWYRVCKDIQQLAPERDAKVKSKEAISYCAINLIKLICELDNVKVKLIQIVNDLIRIYINFPSILGI